MTSLPFPPLPGSRLDLVPLSDGGLPDMFEYSSDPRFYEFMEFAPHTSVDDTRLYLDKLRGRMAAGGAHYWFVRLRDTGKIIGTFGVHSIDWRKKSGEIGYGIAPAHWGRGYFTEALQVVVSYLFCVAGFHRISATTPSDNVRSVRSLVKAGFVQEGRLRHYYLDDTGRRYDAAVLSLLADDFDRFPSSESENNHGH